MKYEISCDPTYAAVEVQLENGERFAADAGAMAWMTSNMKAETSTRGGMMAGLKRKVLSGESFFQNVFYPQGGPGSVTLAPGSAGNVAVHELSSGELLLEKGAYLASSEGIKCDAKFDGLRGFFNEGMFVLRVTGTGTLFFHAYGDIHPVDVRGEYIVDNGYAVAWEPTLTYQLTRGKRIRSFLFADQLLLRFSGMGRIWLQSRSPRSLANWVYPFRRVETKND